MHLAIVKINFYIHYPVACQNAFFRRFHHTFLHRRHKYTVHVLASERLCEFQTTVSWLGFNSHPDFGELAGAASLLLVTVLRIALGLDGLPITHPWFG